MSLIPCPTCGLPRAGDDVDAVACPVCGYRPVVESLPTPEPTAEPSFVASEAPRPSSSRAWVVYAGALVAVAVAVVAFLRPPAPTPVQPTPEPVARAPLAPTGVADIEVAPRPRLPVEVAPEPHAALAPAAVAPPAVAVAPAAPKAELIELADPEGEHELPVLKDGRTVRVVGRVKKLTVAGMDGGAVLDASGLTAHQVEFVGPVGGGARATVAARVALIGAVNGADTNVDVTLTASPASPGGLRFLEMNGPAKLRYRMADGSTAPPYLSRGPVRDGAVFERAK